MLDCIRAGLAHRDRHLRHLPFVRAAFVQPPAQGVPHTCERLRLGWQRHMQFGRDGRILQRNDRHVVQQAVYRNQLPDRERAGLLRRPGAAHGRRQRVDAGTEYHATALHQAVGIEQQHLAASKHQLVLGTPPVRERPQRRGWGHLQYASVRVRDHDRREVAGGGVPEHGRVRVEHGVAGGRHHGLVERVHEPVDELERAAGAMGPRSRRSAVRCGAAPSAPPRLSRDRPRLRSRLRRGRGEARSRRTSPRRPPRGPEGNAPRRSRRPRRPAAWAAGSAAAPSTRRARARTWRIGWRARSPAPRARRRSATPPGRPARTCAAEASRREAPRSARPRRSAEPRAATRCPSRAGSDSGRLRDPRRR